MLLLVLGLAGGGCDGRRTVTGDTSLTAVTVRVHAPAALAAAAHALGWPADAVPGALVIVRSGAAGSVAADSALTNAAGVAHFSLPFGNYTIGASRTLTDPEQAAIGDALGGASSFSGVLMTEIGTTEVFGTDVILAPADRGALLFSEIFPSTVSNIAGTLLYYYGDYVKIYNTSDTTIALAGKLFIDAFPGAFDTPTYNCSTFAALMRDAAGIWAQLLYRFPPNARVLRPGESAVLATDAIDHRSIGGGAPGFFDLSRADFEFRGASDVDNPLVPDMVSVGPRDGGLGTGHGWGGWELRPVLALAIPLDLDTLPKQSNAGYDLGVPLVRVPAAALLDVVTYAFTDPSSLTPCASSVVPAFDAAEARLLSYGGSLSMHRRVSRVLSNGRVILQRTHNSAADWVAGPGTPFGVP